MALLPYPTDVFTTTIEFHLDYSRQIVQRSRYSAHRFILNRGYPEWTGYVQLGKLSWDDPAARHVEAWLSGMDGIGSTTRVPLERPTIAESTVVISSSLRADGAKVHSLANALPADNVGHILFADDKLYMIRSISGTDVVLDPQRPIADATAVIPTDYITARSAEQVHPEQILGSGGNWGPWVWNWIEA